VVLQVYIDDSGGENRPTAAELAYLTFDKIRQNQGAIADNKRLGAGVLAMIRDEQLRRGPWTPKTRR
jgi:hypothetical protein